MPDPFKRIRAKATRKIRRATVSAMLGAWGSIASPAKPAKRRAARKVQTVAASAGKAAAAQPKTAARSKVQVSPTSQSSADIPRHATFNATSYTSGSGTRRYRLYVPAFAKTAPGPVPLIVMLHGCGQSPADFARGTGMNALAEEFGFLVLYPAQAREAQRNRCWNWFRRSDQTRGAGEPALIAGLTRHIISEHEIDPAKVYIAGMSAGGAAALIAAHAYPDIFAAVGVHSGLAVGAASDPASAARAMQAGAAGQRSGNQIPTIVFHGDADRIVNPRNGRFVAIRAVEAYDRMAVIEKTGQVRGGRAYTRTLHRIGQGRPFAEHWVVSGSGHAWSGGHAAGSYTDPSGPDASREMVRFFLRHRTTKKRRAAFGS